MLYSDCHGQIFEHPYYRMVGFTGTSSICIKYDDLIPMPEVSKLFFIPDCPPIGLDPSTMDYKVVPEIEMNGAKIKCYAVAAFLEPASTSGWHE